MNIWIVEGFVRIYNESVYDKFTTMSSEQDSNLSEQNIPDRQSRTRIPTVKFKIPEKHF